MLANGVQSENGPREHPNAHPYPCHFAGREDAQEGAWSCTRTPAPLPPLRATRNGTALPAASASATQIARQHAHTCEAARATRTT